MWQKAMQLATEVYRLAEADARRRGKQIRRRAKAAEALAASVPANVAEGQLPICCTRNGTYAHFVSIARGSLARRRRPSPIVGNFGWVAAREGDVRSSARISYVT